MDGSMQMDMMSGGMMWCGILFLILVASSIIQTTILIKILKYFKNK